MQSDDMDMDDMAIADAIFNMMSGGDGRAGDNIMSNMFLAGQQNEDSSMMTDENSEANNNFPDMQTHKNRECSLGHLQYHKIRANIGARKTCFSVYLESQFQISGEINPTSRGMKPT
jgi:hypothetical protein